MGKRRSASGSVPSLRPAAGRRITALLELHRHEVASRLGYYVISRSQGCFSGAVDGNPSERWRVGRPTRA